LPEPAALSRAFHRFATGIAVVEASTADGALVTAEAEGFNSVSLDPPLVLWTLDHAAQGTSTMRGAARFMVHLASETPAAAQRAAVEMADGTTRVPCCSAWFACDPVAVHEEADRLIFIARIRACGYTDHPPLVKSDGRYVAVRAHPAAT
jgi:flavin reductase (DIM6/NTAB) family NADH-FMN oxidoreductase RutF